MTNSSAFRGNPARAVPLRRVSPDFLLALAVSVGLPAANGGYFPTSWGWAGLALVLVAVLALLVRARPVVGRWELGLLACWTALVGWVWLSTRWSAMPGATILEGERALVFLGSIAAIVAIRRRGGLVELASGLLAGITLIAAYALATRLIPGGGADVVAPNRLARPIGYWNALGIFCSLGVVLAVGLAAHARRAAARALPAAALPILVTALYFTYSRGSWLALGFGLAVAIAVDRRRLRLATSLLLSAPAPAVAVAVSSHSHALTQLTTSLAQERHDGHRLAVELVALAALGGLIALAAAIVEHRLRPPRLLARAYASALVVAALAGAAAALAHFGGPMHLASRAYHSFTGPPPVVGASLNNRLFSLSSNQRIEIWHAAWHDAQAHPVLGAGAGTFDRYWLAHRTVPMKVRDAHSLYLETLAELGPPGLTLLVAALALPLAAGLRARRRTLVAPVLGAYAAFLLHAGADWDWEVTGVTLTALLCGVGLVCAADDGRVRRELQTRTRAATAVLALPILAMLFVGLVGNIALGRSADAAQAASWRRAAAEARRAERWAPWSTAPLAALGEAQRSTGKTRLAAATFRRALAKDRGDWALWFDLARATQGAAQRRALAQAARLNPRSAEVRELRRELRQEPVALVLTEATR